MRILNSIKGFIQKTDFFGTTQFFRYKSETEFKSLFGGIASLIMFTVIGIMFADKFLQCINKENITTIESKSIAADPTRLEISTYPAGNFMMAVKISGIDVNDPSIRYFDIVVSNKYYNYTKLTGESTMTNTTFTLEPCTMAHWAGFPEMEKELNLVNISKLACLPMGMTFSLQGKSISPNMNSFNFEVKQCTASLQDTRRCATTAQMSLFFSSQKAVEFQLYFTNTLINSNNQEYLSYYLDDRYYALFSQFQGIQGYIYVQDYTILTDQNIYPIQNIVQETAGIVQESMVVNSYTVQADLVYCQVIFMKSSTSRLYERSFEKIDQILAFAGGLFGIISASLFIVVSYNNIAYEMNIGSELFKPVEGQTSSFKKYSFLSFIKQSIHGLISAFGYTPKWQTTLQQTKCQKEVKKQLDVLYLLERLLFLESAISTILEDHQVKGIHLRQKPSLEQAKKRREAVKLKKEVDKMRRSNMMRASSMGLKDDGNLTQNVLIRENFSNLDPAKDNQNPDSDVHMIPVRLTSQTIDPTQMNTLPQIQPQPLMDNDALDVSFSSDDSSEPRNEQEKAEIFEEIAKLQQEAKKGSRMSKKIMDLTSKTVADLLNMKPAGATGNDGESPFVFNFGEFIEGLNQAAHAQNQNQNTEESLEPIQKKPAPLSKFAEKSKNYEPDNISDFNQN